MRFLVTGASGFVGQHLVPRLLEDGEVTTLQRPDGPNPAPAGCTALEGDITDAADLGRVPPMDVVIHLAAEASPQRAKEDPARTRLVNVDGTRNVAALARRHGARLVFLSTGQVYGPSPGRPLREEDALRPQGPYATSKADAEAVVTEAKRVGLRSCILRCFNMYGPRQVGPYVVPDLMAQLVAGRTPSLRDLAPQRDFLFIGDAVEAMALAATAADVPAILNVASGTTVSIGELAATACRLAGVPPPDGPWGTGDRVEADVTRLHRLGWRPRASLEDGLEQTLAWWRSAKP